MADLDYNRYSALANEITTKTGVYAEGMAVDLADEQSVKSWARKIIETYNSIDVLVNNSATKSPNVFSQLGSAQK